MNLEAIIDIDRKHYMPVFGSRFPVSFVRGDGCTLYDTEGKAYTDFLAGIAVNALGYNHRALTKAICEQAGRLMHCSSYFYIEQQAVLARMLSESSGLERVFFGNSGAEANEGAIKLARKYFYERGESRYEIITTENSFHGRTMATLAATGQAKYHKPFEPMQPSFVSVPYGNAAAVKNAITDKTCAVMVEPIQGEGGVITPPPSYLQELADICREYGILLILDEIQTGMGRTGKLFAHQHYGVKPDIMTVAKALGGGVPIGAFLAKESVAAAFKQGDHGSTFGGNPLACAAGIAVMTELTDGGLVAKCAETGAYFKSALEGLMAKTPAIKSVRGMGLMLGVQIDAAKPVRDIVVEALKNGFVIGTAGNNTLRFVPPLIISRGEIDSLIAYLPQVLV